METTLKRVYVGGLGPSVTKAELTERFGKFGKVNDVDIISRKDEQGNPMKTFAYLNINISEADLKKCISTLNKTKWKGGVLQIEMAKESFLHKLEQERQQVKEKEKAREQRKLQNNLVQSLAIAGITDFQMKAAVPGTEVPNHKNWVVSKFGRVLPVLHLNGSKQIKIIKYDPSKFCHNIKKIDDEFEPVPVSKLTWRLEGGDDEVSRKRRGEFPDFKIPSKKKPNVTEGVSDQEKYSIRKNTATRTPVQTKNQRYLQNKSVNSMSDVEYDSEEELQAVLEEETSRVSVNHAADSNLEVVDDSFELSYTTHWAEKTKKKSTCTTDYDEYDSADTDEIITVSKTGQNSFDNRSQTRNKCTSIKLQSNKDGSADIPNIKNKPKDTKLSKIKSDSESDASATDSSDSYSDEEYTAMMQNCYHLNLTMGDLEALAKKTDNGDSDDTDEESEHFSESSSHDNDGIGQSDTAIKRSVGRNSKSNAIKKRQKTKDEELSSNEESLDEQTNDLKLVTSSPYHVNGNKQRKISQIAEVNQKEKSNVKQVIHARKKGIEPDDILASIIEDDDSEGEQPKRKTKAVSPVKLPAFKGLGSLLASTVSEGSKDSSSAKSCDPLDVVADIANDSNLDISISKGNKKNKMCNDSKKKLYISKPQKASSCSDTSSNEISSDESSSDSSAHVSPPKPVLSQSGTATEQTTLRNKQQDNQKRLAAMEERRKERELQKQTIQGALLKLDVHSSKKTHIVFNSDSESAVEENKDASTCEPKVLHSDIKAITSTAKLFNSSEEDSDDEDKKDDQRFEIKAQFEGRSGEKLMQLQSRFGVDERFKMDSRFLESSSEDEEEVKKANGSIEDEDLSAEKKKNLGILHSIININVEPQPTSKQAVKAKKFKDLNALQYDPTKEEHTTFESKTEEKKESKAQRKKKRLEAEKLPEVSKDTYHEINVDLKEVFGVTQPETTQEPETTWDQEPEKMESEVFSFQKQKEEESTGFTFSFFGNSVEESASKNEPYKTELIKPAKVAWQEDPRFLDSSSEEDDEEPDTAGDAKANTSPQPEKSSMRFFFFIKDDERLKTGPKMFFQSSNTDQGAWEQRQDILLEECRKRHKAAKRKIKIKH
ncbi:nucleolar protein 8 [Gastrophryne carolinensis]